MKKFYLRQRVSAFIGAVIILVSSVLSYSGGNGYSYVRAEESRKYLGNMQVAVEDGDIRISWDYQEEAFQELEPDTYLVCVVQRLQDGQGTENRETIGKIVVEQKAEESSTVEEPSDEEASSEEQALVELSDVEINDIEEIIRGEEQDGKQTGEPNKENDAQNESQRGQTESAVVSDQPTEKKVEVTFPEQKDIIFSDATGQDAEYVLQLKQGEELIEDITQTYQAECKLTFNIEGTGKVVYGGNSYTQEFSTTLDNHNRVFTIHETENWRLDKEKLLRESTGANFVFDESANSYQIQNVQGDISVVVRFIEKLETPKLQVVEGGEISMDENNPTIFSKPFFLDLLQNQYEDVKVKYTLDGSNPAETGNGKLYESSVAINSYQKLITVKAYAYVEDGSKDTSEAGSWYCKIVPDAPTVAESTVGLSEDTKISDTGYIETKSGKAKLELVHDEISENTYKLQVGIGKDNAVERWLDASQYTGEKYVYVLPRDLTTGKYNVKLRYQTVGGNVSKEETMNFSFRVDHDEPAMELKVTTDTDSQKDKEIVTDSWVNHEVTFYVNANVLSGIQKLEYSTDNVNFQEIEIANPVITIPLSEILETGTSVYLKSISKTGQSTTTSGFKLKKDVQAPGGIAEENMVVENLTDSSEDKENMIYSKESIVFHVSGIPEREEETGSRILTYYRLDPIGENGKRQEGKIQKVSDGEIQVNTQGKYEVVIWNEDEAGNKSLDYRREICYDNKAPEIISNPHFVLEGEKEQAGYTDYKFFAKDELKLKFTAQDLESGLSRIIIKNGESILSEKLLTANTKKTDFEIGISKEGKYRLSVVLYDKSGEYVSITSGIDGFIIDNSGPELRLSGESQLEEWKNQDITCEITGTDAGAGMRKVTAVLNGTTMEKAANGYQESLQMSVTASEEAQTSEGYFLKVEATNNANEKQTLEKKVLLDKTAPKITLSGMEPNAIINENAMLTIKVEEQIFDLAEVTLGAKRTIDHVTASYPIGTFKCNAIETVNQYGFEEDGIYEVVADAVDRAGNRAEQQRIEFTVDRTAPEIKISGVEEDSYQNKDVTMQVEVTESFFETNEVTIKATRTIDGTTSAYPMNAFRNTGKISTMSYSFTEDGMYQIEVSATDKAGNTSAIQKWKFTIDKTTPEVFIEGIENYHVTDQVTTIVFGVIESFYDTNKVTIDVTRQDVAGNVKRVPVAAFQSTGKNSKVNYEFKEEGIYILQITALDKAGNEASTEKILTIDTSDPIINYMEEYDGKYLQAFHLKHPILEMIQDFTIADYTLTLNGDAYDENTTVTKEGKYLFKVEVTDEVNHKSEAQAEFIIDNTAPEIIFMGASDGEKSYEPIELSIKLDDEQDRFTAIFINGKKETLAEKQNSFQTLLDEFNTYDVVVNSIDYAGNTNSKSIQLKYAKKPFYVKLYENKPVFYGTIAVSGTGLAGVGTMVATGRISIRFLGKLKILIKGLLKK